MPQKVMGIAKDPNAMPPVPDFKVTPVHDLNSIPVYTGQEALRFTREDRYWYPRLVLLPVPQMERDTNPELSQNPGWE